MTSLPSDVECLDALAVLETLADIELSLNPESRHCPEDSERIAWALRIISTIIREADVAP